MHRIVRLKNQTNNTHVDVEMVEGWNVFNEEEISRIRERLCGEENRWFGNPLGYDGPQDPFLVVDDPLADNSCENGMFDIFLRTQVR